MPGKLLLIAFIVICATGAYAQKPAGSPAPVPAQARPSAAFDLMEYGVQLQPDSRLIVMMAALDAAGFDPTPAGKEPSAFRQLVRRDQAGLDSDLRERLSAFYQRNKLPVPATVADQAARYISLAYAMSQPPLLDAPERSDDLPGGVLEVLDFAPLVREFYRKSGIGERLVSYTRAYQAEGDRLKPGAAEMVRAVLSYLHTRPILVSTERVRVKSPDKKHSSVIAYSTREHERRFYIVPDLMAAPGAINLRVITDDYFAIIPETTDPTSSELRRAFVQFVIDPLVLKYNKEIAAQREQIKQLIDARSKDGGTVSPDVFVVVSRSLVAAADARYEEATRLAALTANQRRRLAQAKDEAARALIAKESEAARAAIADETFARLAEEYENGAALDFFYADQLRDFQSSGFDIANFFADMVSGFDVARESKRLASVSTERERALAARRAHPRYSVWLIDHSAETRDTTDDDLQTQRLNRALANYRLAVAAASPESDKVLLSRAHETMGRILAFLDKKDEAVKEFDEAIKIGPINGGAYNDAIAGKKKLTQPSEARP